MREYKVVYSYKVGGKKYIDFDLSTAYSPEDAIEDVKSYNDIDGMSVEAVYVNTGLFWECVDWE